MTAAELADLLVESMARAIGSAWKMGPWDAMDAEYQETFRAYASAAFAAQRITLKSAGLFIGPEMATPRMIDVAERAGHSRESAVFMWHLMRSEWQRGGGA